MAAAPPEVVLVTGAAGNLGGAVARAFAARGARLVLTDGSAERLVQAAAALPGAPLHHAADLTDEAAALGLCRRIETELGRIDVLVNIAGGFRMGAVHETSGETWDWLMDTNARTVLNLARGVVPVMRRQGSGRIVNVAARPALQGAAGLGAYAASKAAVLRLTESMAAEPLGDGVTVNAVLPSVLDTPQNRQAMPGEDPARWVSPDSLAGVILFLASAAARDVSGAAIPVYGRA